MSPTHADGFEVQTHAERDSPALCRCQSGMPLGRPITHRSYTSDSTLVIGSHDILLHRGSAAEATAREFVLHVRYRQFMATHETATRHTQ